MLFFALVINGNYWLALVAFLGTFLDVLDGYVAKRYGKVSAFGGFLDSTLDRVSDFFYIAAFPFAGIVSWELATILLVLSFLISYMRSRGELASGGKVSFKGGLVERAVRLGGIFAALLLYTLFPSVAFNNFNLAEAVFVVLIIFSLITVVQRLSLAYKQLR